MTPIAPQPAFPTREEALRRQEEKLARARERLRDALAYERLKAWFVDSGALADLRERAAAWIEKQASDPAGLEERILAWLGDGKGLSRLNALLLDAIEPLLEDEARMKAFAERVSGWVGGKLEDRSFLWAVHDRVKRMGGVAGRVADLTGVVDYYELTHQVAEGLSGELKDLSGRNLDAFTGVLRSLLSEVRAWDASNPESLRALASLLAELVRAQGPALAASVRGLDPSRIPPWLDRALLDVYRRACGMALDAAEAVLLPAKKADSPGLANEFVSVLQDVISGGTNPR
jgi:hypothetical protein